MRCEPSGCLKGRSTREGPCEVGLGRRGGASAEAQVGLAFRVWGSLGARLVTGHELRLA